jgi:hypothetical protein
MGCEGVAMLDSEYLEQRLLSGQAIICRGPGNSQRPCLLLHEAGG